MIIQSKPAKPPTKHYQPPLWAVLPSTVEDIERGKRREPLPKKLCVKPRPQPMKRPSST